VDMNLRSCAMLSLATVCIAVGLYKTRAALSTDTGAAPFSWKELFLDIRVPSRERSRSRLVTEALIFIALGLGLACRAL
jgi:hypothetical protein